MRSFQPTCDVEEEITRSFDCEQLQFSVNFREELERIAAEHSRGRGGGGNESSRNNPLNQCYNDDENRDVLTDFTNILSSVSQQHIFYTFQDSSLQQCEVKASNEVLSDILNTQDCRVSNDSGVEPVSGDENSDLLHAPSEKQFQMVFRSAANFQKKPSASLLHRNARQLLEKVEKAFLISQETIAKNKHFRQRIRKLI